jgi:hypothetical protein
MSDAGDSDVGDLQRLRGGKDAEAAGNDEAKTEDRDSRMDRDRQLACFAILYSRSSILGHFFLR